MKESKAIARIFLGTSIALLFLDLFINYRLWSQTNGVYYIGGFLGGIISSVVQAFILMFSFAGIAWSLLIMKVISIFSYTTYVFVGAPSVKDDKPMSSIYFLAIVTPILYILIFFISPYYMAVRGDSFPNGFAIGSILVTAISYLAFSYSSGKLGRWLVLGGSSGMKGQMEDDPFGAEERRFHQTTDKIENKYSINIPYQFVNPKGNKTKGWINVINPFRAAMVIGTPGSGKSFTFFLAAIHQMVQKGFTMLIYDFKYRELSEYTLNCHAKHKGDAEQINGKSITFHVITFDYITESARCNVLQPKLLKDFTIDAYGASNIFLTALNKTWSTKEGDFFPESAKNLTAAGIWSLRIYEKGRYCSIPHLIEFLSMDTESIIKCLVALKDNSLSNVIRPFEEALRDEAFEQLQGQMGTVRIAMSRLTSPSVYWILTEDDTEKPFSLEINSKEDPKILCLGSSGKNQMINNIFFSLFIAQIFRLVNVKGRFPLGIMLDEVTTLSFPKGTLDTLIATGRSNLVSVWLGFQDLSQLIRDFTKDVAEALFKMIGNIFSGNVQDDTAERMMKRIGKMRVMKRSMSVGANGEPSFSYSEQNDYAVPDSAFGTMSQGSFAGTLADEREQPLKVKQFYGDSLYMPEFTGGNMPEKIKLTPFWQNVMENECKGKSEEEKEAYVDMILQMNFEKIRQDIFAMREKLIEGVE
jgi:hypothetical protein